MKAIKKSISLILIFTLLFVEFIPYMVKASTIINKGDIRLNDVISSTGSVTVVSGSYKNPGDIEIKKTVKKTDISGRYAVNFKVRGMKKEVTSTKPIYATIVFDKSGSMICDDKKNSYSSIANKNNIFNNYTSFDNVKIHCSNDISPLVSKWESAVNGATNFIKEIVSINNSKVSVVTFSSNASTASSWYTNDVIDKSIFSHPFGATNLKDGINKAQSKLNTIDETNALKVMIIISDGNPTEPNNPITSAINASNDAKKAGIKIFTIGYETDESANNVLKSVSGSNIVGDKTNYDYTAEKDNLSGIFSNIAKTITTLKAGTNAVLTDNIGSNFTLSTGNTNKVFNIGEITENEWTSETFYIDINPDSKDGWYETNDGFALSYTDINGINKTITSNNNPEVYWIQNKYDYRIEYYYDGIKDSNKDIVNSAYKDTIINVTDDMINNNKIDGYDFVSVNPTSKSIAISNNKENVIKVYYTKKDMKYSVYHYLEDDNEPSGYILKEKEENKSIKYGDSASFIPKDYKGYVYTSSLTTPINKVIKSNDIIIKLYYEKSDYNYKINYYYNGIIDNNKTEILKGKYLDKIVIDNNRINNNKKNGYTLSHIDPISKSITISDDLSKNVINVYYEKAKFNYKVEHYIENINDNNYTLDDTDYINNVLYDSDIKYELNVYTGFTYSHMNPTNILKVPSNNNLVIKLYYNRNNYQYGIEYYYDGIIDNTKTETLTGSYLDKKTVSDIKINNNNKTGYKFSYVNPGKTITISDNLSENIIKIYYIKDIYQYRLEYYYDNIIDNTKTEILTGTYLDKKIIDDIKINNNKKDGYTLSHIDPISKSITISDNSSKNIIKIYYEKAKFNYKVEHYLENINDNNYTLDDTDYYTNVLYDSIIKYELNTYTGFKYNHINPTNVLKVPSNNDLIIKLYYNRNLCKYSVNYYYSNNIDLEKQEIIPNIKYGTIINNYKDKLIKGYYLLKVDNRPLKVIDDNGIINVYYEKEKYNYKINYYYDGIIDNTKTETLTGTYLDKIVIDNNRINNNKKDGYILSYVDPISKSITISDDLFKNVINVYYEKAKFNYKVEHYIENINDNNYTLDDTDYYTNVLYGTTAIYSKNVYTNNTYTKTVYEVSNTEINNNIVLNNDLVIKVYYSRNIGSIIIHYVVKDNVNKKYISFKDYGIDNNGNNIESFNNLDLDDLILNDKIGLVKEVEGRRPIDFDFKGIYEGNLLENSSLVLVSNEEKLLCSILKNIQEYTYVYDYIDGYPPKTGFNDDKIN